MITINITTLNNVSKDLERIKNYYSSKGNIFSRGAFGVSGSPNLANYLGKIQTTYQAIASNIDGVRNYLKDYTDDAWGLETISSGHGTGYFKASGLDSKVSKYKNSLKETKFDDNMLFKINTLSLNSSSTDKTISDKNFGTTTNNDFWEWLENILGLPTSSSTGFSSSMEVSEHGVTYASSTFLDKGNSMENVLQWLKNLTGASVASSTGFSSSMEVSEHGVTYASSTFLDKGNEIDKKSIAKGIACLGGLNVLGISSLTGPLVGYLSGNANKNSKIVSPFTTFEFGGKSIFDNSIKSVNNSAGNIKGASNNAINVENSSSLGEVSQKDDISLNNVVKEPVAINKVNSSKSGSISKSATDKIATIKAPEVASNLAAPVPDVGKVAPIVDSLDSVENLDTVEVLDVPTEVMSSPVTPIAPQESTVEVVTPEVEPVLPPDGPIADTGEVSPVTDVATPEVSTNTFTEQLDYRMTYYYPGDNCASGTITASGLSTKDFTLNDRGWYTYNGKLVVATANKALTKGKWAKKYGNSTQRMYNLYDELTLEIDGVDYPAIVLDMCGAAMKAAKIDLFVKDRKSGLDTQIKVKF